MSIFTAVSEDVWRIECSCPRRQNLFSDGLCFEELVEPVLRGIVGIELKRERCLKNASYFRASVILELRDTEVVQLFHNSRYGYRAQYYSDAKLGEEANRFWVKMATPRIIDWLYAHPKRSCRPSWIEITSGRGGEGTNLSRTLGANTEDLGQNNANR